MESWSQDGRHETPQGKRLILFGIILNTNMKGKQMNPKVVTALKEIGVQAFNAAVKWFNTPDAQGRSPKDKFLDEAAKYAEAAKVVFSPEGLKVALSYEEHSYAVLGFADLLAKVKSTYGLKPGERICILKTDGDITTFDVVAIDAEGSVLFSPVHPWSRYIVANPEESFIQMFANKPMLVLK